MENITESQWKLIQTLCEQLGYDAEDYHQMDLTKREAREVIGEMLREIGTG